MASQSRQRRSNVLGRVTKALERPSPLHFQHGY